MSWLLPFLCLVGLFGTEVQESTANGPKTAAEALEAWSEAVAFDLPGELLRDEEATLSRWPALRKNGRALDLRVSARLLVEQSEAARQLIEATPLAAADSKYAKLARARIALFEDRLEEVSTLLQTPELPEVISECSELADAWLLLGRAHSRGGNDSDADLFMHQFIRRDPLHAEAYSAWHILAQNAIRHRQAAAAQRYSKAADQAATWHSYYRARRLQVRENPEAILPRIGLVILWMQAEQPQSAKDELQRIFAIDPNNCEAWGHLAEAERKLEQLDAAKVAYDRALTCDPLNAGLRFNRAFLAGLQGRSADARSDYEWLVASEHATEKRYLDAHLQLARLLLGAGETDLANARYERYTELGGKQLLTE